MADDETPERTAPQVQPYDPAWHGRGVALADEVAAALGAPALRVEHIGSTAIPGMAAKAIIDLQVSVDLDTYAEVKDPVVDVIIAAAEEWAAPTASMP